MLTYWTKWDLRLNRTKTQMWLKNNNTKRGTFLKHCLKQLTNYPSKGSMFSFIPKLFEGSVLLSALP